MIENPIDLDRFLRQVQALLAPCVREVGAPLADGETKALPHSHDEIEKLLKIAPRYGVEFLVPGK